MGKNIEPRRFLHKHPLHALSPSSTDRPEAESNVNGAAHVRQAPPATTSNGTGYLTTLLVRTVWAICVALIVSSLILDFLTPEYLTLVNRSGPVLSVFSGLLSLVSPTVGVLVASRFPKNPVGWIFCGMGFLYGVQRFAMAYADYALRIQPELPLGEQTAWLSNSLRFWEPTIFGVLLVLLFPAGRLPSRRWRTVAWTAIGGAAMLAFGDAFRFGPLFTHYVNNPFGVAGSASSVLSADNIIGASTILGGVMLSASCLGSIVSLKSRLHRARGDERQQLRLLAYAAVPALVGSIVILLDWTIERFASLFLHKAVWAAYWVAAHFPLSPGYGAPPSRTSDLRVDATLEFLTVLAYFMIPICTGIAMLKYRLYGIDLLNNRTVHVVAIEISSLRWLRVVLAGTLAGVLPFAFIYLGVYAYAIVYPIVAQSNVSREQLEPVATFVSGWGAYAFFLSAVILTALWVARRAGERRLLHGGLVGVVGAVAVQAMTHFLSPPITLRELWGYLALGTVGGCLGGVLGRTSLAGKIYQATRQISIATDLDAIVSTIGEHLGGPEVHGVTLWRQVAYEDGGSGDTASGRSASEFMLWASWTPGKKPWGLGSRLNATAVPVLANLSNRPSVVLRTTHLPAAERTSWESQGIRSAILLPLSTPQEAQARLLMVTFRKKRRFSRSHIRAYLTVAAQVALALENLHLVEAARRAGQQAGILLERQRLAREIHDTLAQSLIGIITNLTAVESSRDAGDDATFVHHLEDAKRIGRESLSETRRLVWALRPESLDRRTLPEALDELARVWTRETGTEASVFATGTSQPLLPETEVALLRVTQEALSNVRKHARAARVNITLSYMDDRIVLDVMDDGVGFDPAQLKTSMEARDGSGFGLTAMRERVEELGGALIVESTPGEGTTIAIELPVTAEKPEARGPDALDETDG
ncbi:MAG: TIGR04086 family membrane protein [Actinomycetota bacterium]|nr:TIGR04086 family membrane protein [Actinomycetota bacterium]